MKEGTTVEAKPLSIVVIGASGDLARTKVIPAIFALYCQGFLPEDFTIFGFARTGMGHEEFRKGLTANLTCRYAPDQGKCGEYMDAFLSRCFYYAGRYDSRDDFVGLYGTMRSVESSDDVNRLYYMAIPPFLFLDVAHSIGGAGLVDCGGGMPGWSRAVVEKPFGRDRRSSDELAESMGEVFTENQIYRIDHYLGKEVIQNLLVLRFANRIFEPVWNRDHVESISVCWREDKGVNGRGGYFDEFGILRDVMQNHLLQILALVAMEQPKSLDAHNVRNAKVDVLRAIPPLSLDDAVVGQYGAGAPNGETHPAYREEKHVAPDSLTPTYGATVLQIDNDRWRGVPCFLAAGKGLDRKVTEIRVRFKPLRDSIFCPSEETCLPRNELLIRVQPDEAIAFHIVNKTPGLALHLTETELNLRYKAAFDKEIPDAYESLLLDVLKGDKSLFIRADELEAAWDVFTPLLHRLEQEGVQPETYPFGAENPEGARQLAERWGLEAF